MTLNKAIKLIEKEYEKAKRLNWVNNPLAYALYHVWKMADAQKGNEARPIAADHCIACGAVIPEGRLICPNCEKKVSGDS